MFYRYFKSFVDRVVALILLWVSFPFIILAIIALAIANKGGVWFLQPRPGKNGEIFKIVKFKTMTDEIGKDGRILSDEHRLTFMGRIIRSTSLDELPQLLNVLRGDMSIVGPRPLLVEYLPLYNTEQKRRHNVKPGITGWAQVNGRNGISWNKKFELDVWYVDNQSFLLDLKILFLTIYKVFKAEGINSDSNVTMEKFSGNK